MSTTNRIELYKTRKGWQAQHFGPCRALVVDLFGTDTIPTGFTSNAEPETVKREIEILNPGYDVAIRSGGDK